MITAAQLWYRSKIDPLILISEEKAESLSSWVCMSSVQKRYWEEEARKINNSPNPCTEIKIPKFTAHINICVQVGPDSWDMKRHSKVFDLSASLSEVLKWGELYIKNPTINDFIFSQLDD